MKYPPIIKLLLLQQINNSPNPQRNLKTSTHGVRYVGRWELIWLRLDADWLRRDDANNRSCVDNVALVTRVNVKRTSTIVFFLNTNPIYSITFLAGHG